MQNGPESLEYKIKLFQELDARTPAHVPMTSSTSGFPSSKFITSCTRNPSRILVAHPINPPHLIPAVEIVPHPTTDPETVDRCVAFYRSIGQRPVQINVETPGFVLNRLQAALLFEALSLVKRGVISPGDLDNAVTSGLGLRWAMSGPFMNPSLSGGGGPEGFKRVIDHLGPAAEAWIKDMDAHRGPTHGGDQGDSGDEGCRDV
jgi:3-hydroxyacyl-CoA dehydrogenase